jgi:CRISPR-associated Csx3 family protein
LEVRIMKVKVVVCGPPHSGKSVFLGGLCENLPRAMRYLFRACPDGEGTWTWKGNGAEQYRRKGKFSQENVDWYCQSLKNCEMAPITLVDIGGIPSEENRRILTEGGVTHAVILAGDLEKVPIWEQFLKICNVEIIAVLHSDYQGKEDRIESSPMAVHYLERGDQTVKNRPAIMAVAAKIVELIETKEEEEKEEKNMEFMNGNVLGISALAKALEKAEVERELPNKKIIKQIVWEGSDLPKIAGLLHNHSAELPEIVKIDGAAPAWLVAALAHECHPRCVELNSPDGYIGVHGRRARGNGEGVEFTVKNLEDGWTLVSFALDPSKPLVPTDMDKIAPPELPMGAKVIISGRGPNWLVASLVMGYHGTTKAVACFQPGTGSTVVFTHSAEVELGAVIPE